MKQYSLYLEMADRLSGRRALANSFFLTANMAIISSFVLVLKDKTTPVPLWVIPLILAACLLCMIWFLVVKSYKQLNSGKFKVIHEFEYSLPTKPFAREWEALGHGENWLKYFQLSYVEQIVPWIFIVIYFLAGMLYWCQPITSSVKSPPITITATSKQFPPSSTPEMRKPSGSNRAVSKASNPRRPIPKHQPRKQL